MEYQEKITCKCGNIIYRKLEFIKTSLQNDVIEPLTFLIIKKYTCTKCQETKNFKVNIIKTC